MQAKKAITPVFLFTLMAVSAFYFRLYAQTIYENEAQFSADVEALELRDKSLTRSISLLAGKGFTCINSQCHRFITRPTTHILIRDWLEDRGLVENKMKEPEGSVKQLGLPFKFMVSHGGCTQRQAVELITNEQGRVVDFSLRLSGAHTLYEYGCNLID